MPFLRPITRWRTAPRSPRKTLHRILMVLLDLPFSTDYFIEIFRPHALRPKVVERTRDMGVMRAMVANGFGYSIANIHPQSDLAPDGRRLKHVPLVRADPLRLGLVMAEGAQSRADHPRLCRPLRRDP